MSQHQILIEESVPADPAAVFAVFADHQRFGQMLGAPVKRIRSAEGANPNGVGSVRKIGIGPLGAEETVMTFEPEQLIEYRISRGGAPIRNHHGRIEFSPESGGTRVRYTIDFDSALPVVGPAIARVLETAIRVGVTRKLPKMV